jgi:hypothetical protein
VGVRNIEIHPDPERQSPRPFAKSLGGQQHSANIRDEQ